MKDGVSLLGAGEKTGLLCVGAPAVSAGSGVGADTVISGFTIANGDKGIYCRDGASPTIVNNHFEGNTYGVLCEDGASPTIASNSFEGGLYGIVCADSSPAIINSTISKNKSGIQCYSSSPTIANVTIYGLFEYGIWTDGASSPTITNCIVRESGYADLVNCAATYSNIGTAGQDVGVGNINADPLFVDDFRLRAGSPCIDTGTPDGAPATDKDGVARPFGGGYDMGAYESRWCTFRYVALAGGSIEGNATQVVAHGGSGTTVTAKPAAGHHFVGWSDGVLTAARADTGVTADATYTAAFARVLAAASITRTPDRSSVTLTRKRGTARFTLSAVIKGWGGEAIAGHRVYLQSSRTGERWSNTYGITTTATGKASKAFRIATKRVRYYRWYVPARSEVCLMTYSGVTKVTVR
jgi:parallel beta-helix repeat protein